MQLYHTKNYQGATTNLRLCSTIIILYHTKNYQGATTVEYRALGSGILYHTKNYQGATTKTAAYCPYASHYSTILRKKNHKKFSSPINGIDEHLFDC